MEEDIIKDGEVVDQPLPPVAENIVQFKMISDRTVLQVINPHNNEVMIEISGYDLNIDFNMEHLRSIEDIEAAGEGVKELFRTIIVEKLLGDKQKA